jgi:hypothetical protein
MAGVTRLVNRRIDPRPRRSRRPGLAALIVFLLAACSGTSGGSPSPTPLPQPSGGQPFTAGELRLLLIDHFGPLWYCDRDSYPVGRDEQQAALDSYPEMAADAALFPPVAAKLGIDPRAKHTDAEKLALYRLWKAASAVALEPIGNDRWRFDYLAQPANGATEGKRSGGIVDATGAITVEQEAAAGEPMCPICLALGTRIEAPDGWIAIEDVRIGDVVWTLDRGGRLVAASVIALGSTPAPLGHEVVRLDLADGRSVTASPGHPLADGRRLGEVRVGDVVDGARVVAADRLVYEAARTFDLVVSGETGLYLAGGIPLRSTLDPALD